MANANSRNEQIEFDVFPKQGKADYSYLSGIKEDNTGSASAVSVVLSTQSIVILFICVFMLLVVSFTLGVEKGKLVGARSLTTQPQAPIVIAEKPAAPIEKAVMAGEVRETQKIQSALSTTQKEPAGTAVEPVSGYAIQIASLKSEDAAKGLSDSLLKKGYVSFTKPSGKYIVVLAGGFASREEAQGKLKELKKTYTDCFIRKI